MKIPPCSPRANAYAEWVARAWLLAQAGNVVAIPGTTSMPHLEENVAAAAVRLSPEQIGWLNALPG